MNWMVFVTEQWALISILCVLTAALLWIEGNKGGQAFTFHDVTRLVNKDEAILLDVRDTKDFKGGHITNAVNIPHAKLVDRVTELEKHRTKTIIVVDKMGQHSGSCGKQLKDKGFVVGRLKGGMSEWHHHNLPVVKAS